VIAQRLARALRLAPRRQLVGEQPLHESAQRHRRHLEPLLPRERLELELQRLRRGRSCGRIAREGPHDDVGQRGRVGGAVGAPRRRNGPVDDLAQDLEVARRREGRLARRELVQDRSQREHVAARVERPPAALLGRHVPELALERALLGLRPLVRPLGDAEVGDLHGAVERHEHVRGRDVAVDDVQRLALGAALLVRVVQARGGRRDDADGVLERQRPRLSVRLHELPQVRAVHVLHREERRLARSVPFALAHVVHLRDVRVRERRREPRFVQEHAQQLRVQRVLRKDALDDDQLLEPLGGDQARQKDLGHASHGQPLDELVATQLLTRGIEVRAGRHPASAYA
jgi:hypothetical protein